MTIDEDTRAAWLAWRREGIGASEIAAVCGRNPWASPLSVYLRKRGDVPDDGPSSRAMTWGKRLEVPMADWFAEDAPGLFVVGAQTWCVHPAYTWARCTVDGFVAEHPDEDAERLGVYESKTAGLLTDYDPLPEHVAMQVQWQMFVTEHEAAWVYVLGGGYGGQDARVIEVTRNDRQIAAMTKAGEAFWERVLLGEPPDVTGYAPGDADDLAAAYSEPEPGSVVDLGNEAALLVDELRELKAEAKDTAERITTAENALKARLGDHEAGTVGGLLAVTWKPVTSRRIDTKALRAGAPDVAERFTTETTARRFLLR